MSEHRVDPRGYYRKFQVRYANGDALPASAETFVLRIDEDPHARTAALAYANSIEAENPELARDLRGLVGKYQ